jgi:hypothetical protein
MPYFISSLVLTALIAVSHYFPARIPVLTEIGPKHMFDMLLASYFLLLIGYSYRRA